MDGFIKLPKEIIQHEIFENPLDLRLLLLILKNANYSDQYEHKGQTLNKGQWIRSHKKLQEDLRFKWGNAYITPTVKEIRGAISRVKRADFINFKGNHLGILFSLDEVLIQKVFGHTVNVERADHKAEVVEMKGNRIRSNINNNKLINKKDDYITLTNANICPSFYDVYYQFYGRQLSAIQLQDFISYIEQDGVEEQLLNFAFEVASKVSTHINYVKAIINNWVAKNIRTFKEAELEYNRQRGNKNERTTKDQYSDIDLGW